jgi:hypothetical protein
MNDETLAQGWDTPKVSNNETPVVEPKEEFSPWKKTLENQGYSTEAQAQEEPKGTWVWIPENSASWLETMVSKLVESKLEEVKGNEDDIEQIATNAIENYDFSSLLDQALQEHDFSDVLENDLQQVKDDLKSELADQIREEVEECLSNATISI